MLHLKYDEEETLPIPKDYLVVIILKSGMLDDDCFKDLDNSILNLKKYDPISFYTLSGLGKRLEFAKRSLILPFLNNQIAGTEFTELVNSEINEKVKFVADRINNSTKSSVDAILKKNTLEAKKENREEIFKRLYMFYISIIPDYPYTFEQFKLEVATPEFQEQIRIAFEPYKDLDMEQLIYKATEGAVNL